MWGVGVEKGKRMRKKRGRKEGKKVHLKITLFKEKRLNPSIKGMHIYVRKQLCISVYTYKHINVLK